MNEETTPIGEQLYLVSLELKAAKLQEAIAKGRRIAFEERFISLVPNELKVHEGQTTLSLNDGSEVVTEAGFTVKADIEGIRELFDDFGNPSLLGVDKLYPPIAQETTHTLDLDGYEWYRKNHPDIYNLIAEHVTITPKKIEVELKPARKEK